MGRHPKFHDDSDILTVRLRSFTVTLNRAGFMVNPTSCAPLATESTISGSEALPARLTATQTLATPFAASGCAALHFTPSFGATAPAKTSRIDGASLEVSLNADQGQANLREVNVTLPKQIVARLSTLQKACTEAQAAADILACPSSAKVASATLSTPLLPKPLSGPGVLVSHGGAAFPDLDFVLEGDGLRLIEVSHTDIKHGITSSTFNALPDAPFTSFHATFPTGTDSLFSANGSLCRQRVLRRRRVRIAVHGNLVRRRHRLYVRSHGRLLAVLGRPVRRGRHRYVYVHRRTLRSAPVSLIMPTTLVAQNGDRLRQQTKIAVSGCAKLSAASTPRHGATRRRSSGGRRSASARRAGAPSRPSARR